jgi:hypothetical protein
MISAQAKPRMSRRAVDVVGLGSATYAAGANTAITVTTVWRAGAGIEMADITVACAIPNLTIQFTSKNGYRMNKAILTRRPTPIPEW